MATLSVEFDRLDALFSGDDHNRLQGAWSFVAGPRQAELLIAGDHFTLRFTDGVVYTGTFTLDPTARPKAMDMYIEEGPQRHRGKTGLAIYALDGNRMIWFAPEPGSEQRPQFFPARDERHSLCLVFKRA